MRSSARPAPEDLNRLAISCDGLFGRSPVYMHNELVLRGETHGPEAVEDVLVEVEGRVYHAARGLSRPGADGAGFELRVNTEGWAPGARHVRVVARDAAGVETAVEGDVNLRPYELPAYTADDNLATIAAGRTAMWCETPWLDGSGRVLAPVRVEGWAWCASGIEEVTVDVDDSTRVLAQHGLARPDLRHGLGEDVAATGGFAATLDPAECSPGWHRITVVASGADGRNVGTSGLVECLTDADASSVESSQQGVSPTLLADRYVPEAHVGYSFEPEHHARYRWAATLARGRQVLDAGCGTGFGTEILARSGAERVEGFDVSLEVVEHARARAGDVAEFVVGDLKRIPYGDASFDLITCFEAIEHIDDPFRALDELRRVLMPSGVLLISTPNRGVYPEGNPHHLRELSSGEFEAALRGRFRHVRVCRQQTHATSLLGSDETFGLADSSVSLRVDVRKVAGATPGEELYTVAAASDETLPELSELAVIGSALDLAARTSETEAWKQRALLAEAAAAAARVDARGLRAYRQQVVGELAAKREPSRTADASRQYTDGPRSSNKVRAERLGPSAFRRLTALLSSFRRRDRR